MLFLHDWLFPLILHIPRIWRVYYLAPPSPLLVHELGSPLLPPASHSTFSAHKVSNSYPWLKLNTLDDIWTPTLNSFIYPLFCGLPNYFFVMICCWQKEQHVCLGNCSWRLTACLPSQCPAEFMYWNLFPTEVTVHGVVGAWDVRRWKNSLLWME